MIVIVDANQVYKLQMTSKRSSLASNTLHGASIAEEAVGVIVDQVKTWLVESCSRLGLSNSEANGIRKPLSERTSSHFDTWGILSFWMARGNAIDGLFVTLLIRVKSTKTQGS